MTMKGWTRELKPIALDDLGLVAAVQWYVEEYSAREGIHVAFKTQGAIARSAPAVELAVYRAVREAA